MLRITDKQFKYTPSYNTNLRARFKKLLQEQRAADARKRVAEEAAEHSVVRMAPRRVVQGG